MRPAVRQKAVAILAPVLNEAHALQQRAAERMHAARPDNAALAQVAAEPAKVDAPAAAVIEVKAPEPEVAAPIAPSAVAASEVAAAAAAAPSDDGEVEDDSPSTDSAPEKTDGAVADKGDGAKTSEPSAVGEKAIAEAHEFSAKGNKIKALNVLRHAAKKVPTDAKVLQELATVAEENRNWGEAARAARHWVAVEPSADSKLELARLERKTGHRDRALELVRSVVKDNPDSPEAHAMLSQLGGSERVALQK
jgi:tetratricopeptide (TPR) repeat protein